MIEDQKVIDVDREVKAWLSGIGVCLGLFCLGHFALIAIGLDADKLCCIYYGLVMWCHYIIALFALMFAIVAGHDYYQRPFLEDREDAA